MEDTLVTKPTATLAKTKNFNENVRKFFNSFYPNGETNVNGLTNIDSVIGIREDFTSLPTQSLLQKWLREVHKIDIYVIGYGFGYYAQLNNVPPANQGEVKYIDRRWNMPPEEKNSGQRTYEEALEFGLQQALKLIPDENKN